MESEIPRGLTQADLDAHARRQAAITEANDTPLPGPLEEAFLPQPTLSVTLSNTLSTAGLTLRRMVPSDEPILLALKSPLILRLKKGAPEVSDKVSDKVPLDLSEEAEAARWHDLWELLYLWTRPVAESRAVLAYGRQYFREQALAATADILPDTVLTEAPAIMQALALNYIRAFATVINYQAPAKEGEVFTVPPTAPATASAGGSPSSAASPHNSTPTRAPSPTSGHSPKSSLTPPGPSRTTHGATPSAPAMAT